MADEAEDVLELEDEIEAEEVEDLDEGSDDEATSEDEDDEGETFVGFSDEEEEDEAAPASESESSVIRELRKANREKERRIAELERGAAPAKIELGPKPTLESCDYDEEAHEVKLLEWHAQKAKVQAQEAEAEAAAEQHRAKWEARAEAFKADKATLGVKDFDDAETEVFSVLPNDVQALILLSEKPAALVYALHRSPAKLEQLSQLNLAEAAMQLGRWERDIKVMKRKAPAPDRPVMGKASTAASGNLDRLLAKARKTGDYSDYYAAKRATS